MTNKNKMIIYIALRGYDILSSNQCQIWKEAALRCIVYAYLPEGIFMYEEIIIKIYGGNFTEK